MRFTPPTLCEGHEDLKNNIRCKKNAIKQLPYARLCFKCFSEAKEDFFSLPIEERARIRREWRRQDIRPPW